MKRWNGWGDEGQTGVLPSGSDVFLAARIGPGTPPKDATFPEALAGVPESRLPAPPLGTDDPAERLRHARGQSLPDWIALRSGRIGVYPDAVAYPASEDDVTALLRFAKEAGARVIPFGAGSSVVGHVNPLPGPAPVITVDLSRMSRLLAVDEVSQLATFEAGVFGPHLEAQLAPHGFTLGHFPQSFEYSTLGGWIAARSSGQQSLGYGRIERLFAGGRLLSPAGTLDMPAFPASAAGPDLKELVLGSEGRLGVVTQATVRVTAIPARESFHAIFFASWDEGREAMRLLAQSKLPLSMLRLSNAVETETNLALAGHPRLIAALSRYLALRGVSAGKCLLLLAVTGALKTAELALSRALALARERGGIHVGKGFGHAWHKGRFRAPYLRNTLWELGYAVDTLETATRWSKVDTMLNAVEGGLREALTPWNEKCHVFTHLSHAYTDGSSLYTTYVFRIAPDPDETLARWTALKSAASSAIVANGGTISHQHGVGLDHRPYLPAEKGELGMAALRDLARFFDPDGLMNPGKLL